MRIEGGWMLQTRPQESALYDFEVIPPGKAVGGLEFFKRGLGLSCEYDKEIVKDRKQTCMLIPHRVSSEFSAMTYEIRAGGDHDDSAEILTGAYFNLTLNNMLFRMNLDDGIDWPMAKGGRFPLRKAQFHRPIVLSQLLMKCGNAFEEHEAVKFWEEGLTKTSFVRIRQEDYFSAAIRWAPDPIAPPDGFNVSVFIHGFTWTGF